MAGGAMMDAESILKVTLSIVALISAVGAFIARYIFVTKSEHAEAVKKAEAAATAGIRAHEEKEERDRKDREAEWRRIEQERKDEQRRQEDRREAAEREWRSSFDSRVNELTTVANRIDKHFAVLMNGRGEAKYSRTEDCHG
ncbi:MAG: hypothetical protein IPL77_11290 [Flavobacteriales bacterium]|nr:hypothetical protein [Flavobacteriales bacterium]